MIDQRVDFDDPVRRKGEKAASHAKRKVDA